MPADLDDYFTAFQGETMSTPTEPTMLRRAAERRIRRRLATAVSAAALATVAIVGTAVALATPSATPPAASQSAGPQPSTSPPPPSPQPTSPSPSVRPDGAPCENTDLKMGVAGGDGFAGGSVTGYSLTNISHRRCSLSGFIRTRYVDGRGQPVAVTSQPDGASHKIDLRPGQTGYFAITHSNTGPGYDGSPCRPPYGRSEYYLPGQATLFHTEPAALCPPRSEQITSFTTVKDPNWHG